MLRCQECGKLLVVRKRVNVPSGEMQFFVRVWKGHPCRRCESPGDVLLVFLSDGCGYPYVQWPTLGEAIRRKYAFFRPAYSDTMEMTYYANHCQVCGGFQGDHYVTEWAMTSGDWEKPPPSDLVPGVFEYIRPYSYMQRVFLPFNIHHIDGDPSNNALENLRVLCIDCHRAAHRTKVPTC